MSETSTETRLCPTQLQQFSNELSVGFYLYIVLLFEPNAVESKASFLRAKFAKLSAIELRLTKKALKGEHLCIMQ